MLHEREVIEASIALGNRCCFLLLSLEKVRSRSTPGKERRKIVSGSFMLVEKREERSQSSVDLSVICSIDSRSRHTNEDNVNLDDT